MGVDAQVWGLGWSVALTIALAGCDHRLIELFEKPLRTAVISAFFASLVLAPRIPAGVDGAPIAAGILGGAVHIT